MPKQAMFRIWRGNASGAVALLSRGADRVAEFADTTSATDEVDPGYVAEQATDVAERIDFDLGQLRYEYPDEPVPPGKTAIQHLHDLAWAGAAWRCSTSACPAT